MLSLLKEGDRRTTGRVMDAVRLAVGKSEYVDELVDLLAHSNPAVRMRAADALEKSTVQHADLLAKHKDHLLEVAEIATQNEIRWHLAQILTRLDLHAEEMTDLAEVFGRWYRRADSRIVKASALQGLVDLAVRDQMFLDEALQMVDEALKSPIPALSARARKLIGTLHRLKAD
ncbi:hypothetical protein V5T82_14870 [Magnetovibrio sp. PR-2]|uniref:hypothetical protein n=1 Tax=Magnetovibrio sp. PR-2 TaxID=3120356 RepID=UPI002FCE3085